MRVLKSIVLAALALTGSVAVAQRGQDLTPTIGPPTTVRAAPPAPQSPPRASGVAELTKADADAWLDGFMPYALRSGDVVGAVVVVVRDGQVLTQRGFGSVTSLASVMPRAVRY